MTSRKPLGAEEIEELRELLEKEKYSLPLEVRGHYARAVQYGYDGCDIEIDDTMHALICGAVNALPRLLSMLTPPPDAEVKEAVNHMKTMLVVSRSDELGPIVMCNEYHLRTLLRAVQSPRLTDEQKEMLIRAEQFCGPLLSGRFRAAFPEAFGLGEVGE